jgi:hypothetical protein
VLMLDCWSNHVFSRAPGGLYLGANKSDYIVSIRFSDMFIPLILKQASN